MIEQNLTINAAELRPEAIGRKRETAMQLCFLFNHDAAHQVAHSIGIAAALAENHPEIRTVIAYGSADILTEINLHITPRQRSLLDWLDIGLPPLMNRLLAPLNRLFPARRLMRLRRSAKALQAFDMIVSTERTCLSLKRRWNGVGPEFTFVPHGAGDRGVSYHPALAGFDWMLLSGHKVADQMIAHGLISTDTCRIIGYPKFDTLIGREAERFFANDNPVFLYNPHFDPALSSWYDEGPEILDWFAHHPEFNLIFAPHVMLFFKQLHVSAEYKTVRRRPDIDPAILECPNILVDTGSPRLFDMSYTLAADAYIGDVSSQIYEFLYHPRAAFFLDTRKDPAVRAAEPDYEFWRAGPVLTSPQELFAILPDWRAQAADYRAAQMDLMDYTADRSDPRPATVRGAEALAGIVKAPLRKDGSRLQMPRCNP